MSDKITSAVIRWARALIADPEHFVQGADATDALGGIRPVSSPDARRWCVVGAVTHALGTGYPARVADQMNQAARRVGVGGEVPSGVTILNDGRNGHARVLAFLDRLADALGREEEAS